ELVDAALGGGTDAEPLSAGPAPRAGGRGAVERPVGRAAVAAGEAVDAPRRDGRAELGEVLDELVVLLLGGDVFRLVDTGGHVACLTGPHALEIGFPGLVGDDAGVVVHLVDA